MACDSVCVCLAKEERCCFVILWISFGALEPHQNG